MQETYGLWDGPPRLFREIHSCPLGETSTDMKPAEARREKFAAAANVQPIQRFLGAEKPLAKDSAARYSCAAACLSPCFSKARAQQLVSLECRGFFDFGIQRQIAAQEFDRSWIITSAAEQDLPRFHKNFRTIHLCRNRMIDGIFHFIPALLVTVEQCQIEPRQSAAVAGFDGARDIPSRRLHDLSFSPPSAR